MFSFQGNAIGIQFHPEMTAAMLNQWIDAGREEIAAAKLNPNKILEDSAKFLPELQKMSHKFFYGFASLVRENVRRAA